MAVLKDSTYHLQRLKSTLLGSIPTAVFRKFDPLTEWFIGTAKRAAEISADIVQAANDFYIDSAKGARLERRLVNELVDKLPEHPADDGVLTVTRQSEPTGPSTFAIGTIKASPPPDPSVPTADRPVYTNTEALTIDVGATSWTVAAAAMSGGLNTNLAIGTVLQMVTQSSLLDGASVTTAFTTGRDAELDPAYKARGKIEIRSRSRGTDDALIAAALRGGAAFVFGTEQLGTEEDPVTLYVADAEGNLPDQMAADIETQLSGDRSADPPILAARCFGIAVIVLQAESLTFDYTIGLVKQAYVVGPVLTLLLADLETAIGEYVTGLNDQTGVVDRTHRINRVRQIVLSFRSRGVIDIDNDTFLPATDTDLDDNQMAFPGTFTWL